MLHSQADACERRKTARPNAQRSGPNRLPAVDRRHRRRLVGRQLDPNAPVAAHAEEVVDDLEAQRKAIEARGGTFFMDLPHDKKSLYYEMKFRDPNGVIYDISESGWVGAKK